MNPDIQADSLLTAIASLPAVAPDPHHAESVRRRCRAALETPAGAGPLVIEPAAAAVCAAYILQLARLAIAITR